MPEREVLRQYQSLPLQAKHSMTLARIREWYDHWNGNVYVSFSGGKDSTVLAYIVHEYYPDVPLVFVNTGLEYPEIQAFARKMGAEFLRPRLSFSEVISKYGYPIISKENADAIYGARIIKKCGAVEGGVEVDTAEAERTNGKKERKWKNWRRNALAGVGDFSKDTGSIYNKEKWLPLCMETQFMISHQCCGVMKKQPLHSFHNKQKAYPIIGTLTEESKMREQKWIQHGCNAFDSKIATSQPLSFWREQDILQFIVEENIEIASVYGDIVAVDQDGMEYDATLAPCVNLKCTGCNRTGCIFCGFGVHLEKGETRFQRLARTHPKQYEYCMRGGSGLIIRNMIRLRRNMTGIGKIGIPKRFGCHQKKDLG